jgi:hypothetical protein
MNINHPLLFVYFILVFTACESKPKIIVADETQVSGQNASNSDGVSINNLNSENVSPPVAAGVHQVTANEVLQSERYTYLNVTEGNQKFWIATAKKEASKGKIYLYQGGLLKTDFESVEFKRIFDTIYLVSNIIEATDHPGGDINEMPSTITGTPASEVSKSVTTAVKDAVKLSELFKNKNKYEGQVITISGTCVKVNNGIMGKNWVHIEDGSKSNGKLLNLTVTTSINIPVGSNVALKGKVSINKDFGAGYKYDIIMEEAGNM